MATVLLRQNNNHQEFFIRVEGKEYYLFSQKPKKSVESFYRGEVHLDKAISHGIGKPDWAIHNTMDKIVLYIEYIESENGIIILKKTARKRNRDAA